jgi:hypothetical protein
VRTPTDRKLIIFPNEIARRWKSRTKAYNRNYDTEKVEETVHSDETNLDALKRADTGRISYEMLQRLQEGGKYKPETQG